jgi:hypothetical protein
MNFKSQIGQDHYYYEHFYKPGMKGTFLDIGASDGISMSNTHMFEKELGWDGICIEPSRLAFEKLVKNRSCICD